MIMKDADNKMASLHNEKAGLVSKNTALAIEKIINQRVNTRRISNN